MHPTTESTAEAILRELALALAGQPVPRARSLHLPDRAAMDRKDGEFGALMLDSGAIGLSYLLLGGTLGALQAPATADRLAGRDALDLARQWLDPDPGARALGFAAVNALTRHLFDRAGFAPPPAADSLAGVDPRPGEHIGMVGLFPPLVPQVLRQGARLTVLELRADLAGERDGYRVTLDPQALARCDKVLCTSTALLNHSLDRVLAALGAVPRIALIGPGAGVLPDPLFRRGITTLAGTWVSDSAGLCAALAAGAPWGTCARKFTLDAAAYPGRAALQAGAAAR